jgi:hypothetical protein
VDHLGRVDERIGLALQPPGGSQIGVADRQLDGDSPLGQRSMAVT